MRVKATIGTDEGVVVGYYDGKRRREGEEFDLMVPSDFSHRWMQALDFKPLPAKGPVLPAPGPATAAMLAEKASFAKPPGAPPLRHHRQKKGAPVGISETGT